MERINEVISVVNGGWEGYSPCRHVGKDVLVEAKETGEIFIAKVIGDSGIHSFGGATHVHVLGADGTIWDVKADGTAIPSEHNKETAYFAFGYAKPGGIHGAKKIRAENPVYPGMGYWLDAWDLTACRPSVVLAAH